MKIQITNEFGKLVINITSKSNNSFDKPKEMMYCSKFLLRISYNNFSRERGEGCWGLHREEADRKTRSMAVHCYWLYS